MIITILSKREPSVATLTGSDIQSEERHTGASQPDVHQCEDQS